MEICIDLLDEEVAVILLDDVGCGYTAQTLGTLCHHPTATGTLVRFKVREPIPHVGCCGDFSDNDARVIQGWLSENLPLAVFDAARAGDDDHGEAAIVSGFSSP